MKNCIILYNPPLPGNAFPVHYLSSLKDHRFYILMNRADYENHHHLKGTYGVEEILPVTFGWKELLHICEGVKVKCKTLHHIAYLAEECVQLAGRLQHHFHLSTDNLDRYIDKDLMMEKASAAGLRTPRSTVFSTTEYAREGKTYFQHLQEKVGPYPLFVKPTNQCGSVGTTRIQSEEEFKAWAAQKQLHTYLVQEYLTGTLFHTECFVSDYKVHHSSVFEYANSGFAFSQGMPVGSISLPPEEEITQRIQAFSLEILRSLGLFKSGIAHIEIYRNERDELIFLEAAARPPGLVGDLLYQKHLGLSIDEAHFLLQLGEFPRGVSAFPVENYAARYIFPITHSGRVQAICDKGNIQSALTEELRKGVGDVVSPSADLFAVAGTMVLWNKNYEALRSDFSTLKNYNPLKIQ